MRRFLLCMLCTISLSAHADCQATSGANTTALLELYTSQGCSSCPPAERWLSQLEAAGWQAQQIVPLAFHVDYWDYLGWKDHYADAANSARQRRAAKLAGGSFVYTPQLLLNGKDLRSWQQAARFSRELATLNRQPALARLELQQSQGEDQKVSILLKGQLLQPAGQAQAFIALYQGRLTSTIQAGENAGSVLQQDYIVRQLYGPYPLPGVGSSLQQSIAIASDRLPATAGLVAFVQDADNGKVLQALQLKACR